MKQIIAIIKPSVAEKVLDGISTLPLIGYCTVREVKGYGRQKNYLSEYRGSEYSMAFIPKIYINFWVEDENLEDATSRIIETARSGRMGDGKIFVLDGDGIGF